MGYATDILQPYLSSWLPFLASDDTSTGNSSSDVQGFPASLPESEDTEITTLDPSHSIPPINRLPPEILLAIFFSETDVHSANYDMKDFRWRVPRRTLARGEKLDPLLLGQVCRQWRNMTLTAPLLWASFFVPCNLKTQTVELLKIWLERSADMPLDINFLEILCDLKNEGDRDNVPQHPITPQIMELLTAHAYRWKKIDFIFSLQISPVLQNLPSDSFKILESAKLRSRRATNVRFDGVPPLVKVWDLFHASPSFRAAQYELEYVLSNPQDIPWSRLTFVDVTIAMHRLFRILPECQNLVELRYTDPAYSYPPPPLREKQETPTPLKPVVLPSLRHLSMIVSGSPDEAFQNLTLPMLASVHIRQNNIWLFPPDPCEFSNLLTRSDCILKKFSYYALDSPVAEKILSEMLESASMSSVVDLVVEVRVTDEFAEWMMSDSGKAALPQLETFTLLRSSMEPGTLGKMISCLKEEHKALRFFEARLWDGHEEDRQKFSELREKGLLIKV